MHKVLLIEDDQKLQDIYADILTQSGFAIDRASDGQTGLNKLTRGGYDAVLLDIMLPEIDGLEILRTLQLHPPTQPNGPIILLTALDDTKYITAGLEAGASGYLVKSEINPDKVVDEINNFLTSS